DMRHIDHLALHASPTRRSSDLSRVTAGTCTPDTTSSPSPPQALKVSARAIRRLRVRPYLAGWASTAVPPAPRIQAMTCSGLAQRSEEHTSELQSREKLVCRLLP